MGIGKKLTRKTSWVAGGGRSCNFGGSLVGRWGVKDLKKKLAHVF